MSIADQINEGEVKAKLPETSEEIIGRVNEVITELETIQRDTAMPVFGAAIGMLEELKQLQQRFGSVPCGWAYSDDGGETWHLTADKPASRTGNPSRICVRVFRQPVFPSRGVLTGTKAKR